MKEVAEPGGVGGRRAPPTGVPVSGMSYSRVEFMCSLCVSKVLLQGRRDAATVSCEQRRRSSPELCLFHGENAPRVTPPPGQLAPSLLCGDVHSASVGPSDIAALSSGAWLAGFPEPTALWCGSHVLFL